MKLICALMPMPLLYYFCYSHEYLAANKTAMLRARQVFSHVPMQLTVEWQKQRISKIESSKQVVCFQSKTVYYSMFFSG